MELNVNNYKSLTDNELSEVFGGDKQAADTFFQRQEELHQDSPIVRQMVCGTHILMKVVNKALSLFDRLLIKFGA